MNTRTGCRVAAAAAFVFAGTVLLAQTDVAPENAEAHTGVRIVRLSQVKGEVKLDRNVNSDGFQNAYANIPITQGAKLQTGAGVAEVEFEDNSTLRLTPDTTIEFTELQRAPSGLTASSVRVLQGTLFVSLAPTKGNEFIITSQEGKLTLSPATRVHFHVGSPRATLAVLDGSVEAQVGATTTTAVKKTTLVFDPANQAPPTLVKHLEKTPYDEWDKTAVAYHQRYMNTSSFGNGFAGSPLYGVSDMNYYGAFSDYGGCGSMWRPYLASALWDPYGNGALAYYPGAGYSFISPYPWGWTPYHSGNWINCPGAGWGWQPGNGFVGINNLTSTVIKKHGIIPPPPPRTGGSKLVTINNQPLHSSGFADRDTFVFSKDSAGLGVPRETFGKLNKVSSSALQHGFVTTAAYSAPVSLATPAGQRTVAFAHAGANPSTGYSSASSARGWSGGGSTSNALPSISASSSSSVGSSHGSVGGGGGHH